MSKLTSARSGIPKGKPSGDPSKGTPQELARCITVRSMRNVGGDRPAKKMTRKKARLARIGLQ